jgi:hypothetical protein
MPRLTNPAFAWTARLIRHIVQDTFAGTIANKERHNMMSNLKAFNTAILLAALTLLLLVPSGCGGSRSTFELKDLGFTMKLPPGWKQGDARMSGGFTPTSKGIFFHENAEYEDPSGSVMDSPIEGESLTLYVENLIAETEKMESLQVNLAQTSGEAVGGVAEAQLREAESYIRTAGLTVTTTRRALIHPPCRKLWRLYDVKNDPGQKTNVLSKHKHVAEDLHRKLVRWLARHEAPQVMLVLFDKCPLEPSPPPPPWRGPKAKQLLNMRRLFCRNLSCSDD